MKPSRNFSFLASHEPELVVLGTFAERYYADDPNTCSIKLRQYAELLAQLTAAHERQSVYPGQSQNDLLRQLRRTGLSSRVMDLFHWLRKDGNDAVHERVGSQRLALRHLQYAHRLAIWFHKTYGDPRFQSQPFVPPPIKTADAELKTELDQLRKLAQVNQQTAESAQAVAQEEAKRRQEVEKHAAELEQKLKSLETAATNQTPQQQKEIRQRSQQFAADIELKEWEVRELIDQQLRDVGWEADTDNLRYSKGTRQTVGRNIAIAEYRLRLHALVCPRETFLGSQLDEGLSLLLILGPIANSYLPIGTELTITENNLLHSGQNLRWTSQPICLYTQVFGDWV